MAHDDDTALRLQRWHDGERDAVVPLLERDRMWIEAQVRRRRGADLRQFEETADGVQELLLRVLDYAPRFVVANRAQFRALLGRMLGNLLVDRARCLGRQPPARTLSEVGASQTGIDLTIDRRDEPPPDGAARAEELGWLRLGLEFLPAVDRRLVRARAFEELDFAAAGAAAGLSADAARMRFQRALLKLAGIVQRLQHGELAALLHEREQADDGEADRPGA